MAKIPLTIRVSPEHLRELQERAGIDGTTVSGLACAAIGEYLVRKHGNIANATQNTQISLSADDLMRAAIVVEAFGKPMALDLILRVMQAQRE